MRGGWVYIMTNRPNGTLYTGVTSDIARRAYEHREALIPGFTKRYGLKRLVYIEFYERIGDAIQRESNINHWPPPGKRDLFLKPTPAGTICTKHLISRQAPVTREGPPLCGGSAFRG